MQAAAQIRAAQINLAFVLHRASRNCALQSYAFHLPLSQRLQQCPNIQPSINGVTCSAWSS
jgi:hypothetical protein